MRAPFLQCMHSTFLCTDGTIAMSTPMTQDLSAVQTKKVKCMCQLAREYTSATIGRKSESELSQVVDEIGLHIEQSA